MPVDVYTLEVTPKQAERLSLAASEGRLHFALRNATDSSDIWTKGITVPELLAYSSWSDINDAKAEKVQPKNIKRENTANKSAVKNRKFAKKKKRVRRRSITVEMIKGTKLKKKNFTIKQ